MGAGLNVSYTGVEKLEVDGLEGDDHFYVLSTNPGMVTTIIGGLGNDTFDVGGDVTTPIVALSTEGTSGFINHTVSSADPAFNGVFAPGVPLNVASAQNGGVILSKTKTTLVEDGVNGPAKDVLYTMKLAAPAPTDGTVAYLTVSAALASYGDALVGGKSVEISTDGQHFSNSLVLTFDSAQTTGATAWDRTQTIYVRAVHDDAQEGERTIVVSSSMQSTNPLFNRLQISNFEATVIDDDKPGLILTEADPGHEVVEGDSQGSLYTVGLTHAPLGAERVTVTLGFDASQLIVSSADPTQASRFDAATNSIW